MKQGYSEYIQLAITELHGSGENAIIPKFMKNISDQEYARLLRILVIYGPFLNSPNGVQFSEIGYTIIEYYDGNWRKYKLAEVLNQKRMLKVAVISAIVSVVSTCLSVFVILSDNPKVQSPYRLQVSKDSLITSIQDRVFQLQSDVYQIKIDRKQYKDVDRISFSSENTDSTTFPGEKQSTVSGSQQQPERK